MRGSDGIVIRTLSNGALEKRVESEIRPHVAPHADKSELRNSRADGSSRSFTVNLSGNLVDGSEEVSGRITDHTVERSPNLATTKMRRFLDGPRETGSGGFGEEHERVHYDVDLPKELRVTDHCDQRQDAESVVNEQGGGSEEDPLEMSLDLSNCSDEVRSRMHVKIYVRTKPQ